MWFEELMGFAERSPAQVRSMITVEGDRLTSKVDGRSFCWGRLETPSLAALRARAKRAAAGPVTVAEVVGDVQALHRDPASAGAVFQVASQFNLLEMTGPSVTPERGVGIYEHDRTQGPACAIACGAGTIYRNYFAPVGDGIGQTADRQIDCLWDVGEALGNAGGRLWEMRNGYALMTAGGLAEVGAKIAALDGAGRDALRGLLRVGVQSAVEVTLGGAGHRVTQVYASAMPVAYGYGLAEAWAPIASLVLEAAYEATLWAAAEAAAVTGNRRVYLTLLGGGAFGNLDEWIFPAIERALSAVGEVGLDVGIVSYRRSNPRVRALVTAWTRIAKSG